MHSADELNSDTMISQEISALARAAIYSFIQGSIDTWDNS